MAGKNKNGNGGGHDDQEHLIEFTPMPGFNIKRAAKDLSHIMEETGQSLLMHLSHVSVEFEAGCTPKEIIDGYNLAMESKMKVKPSNTNNKKTKR